MYLSIIFPVYNESSNLIHLYQNIVSAITPLNLEYEIIAIDDGSKDDSLSVLEKIACDDPNFIVFQLRKNFGQTAATNCGIQNSQGEIIIVLDSDLQNDPSDIPAMIDKINEGYDLVAGYREKRHDKFLRSLLSRIANRIIRKVSGVNIQDLGCSLKAYRREILKHVKLYGEMHRFMAIYAYWIGAKIINIPVKHHHRQYGTSNYGFSRLFKVIVDLFVIKFLGYYATKPMYFFGKIASLTLFISCLLIGVCIFYYNISLLLTSIVLFFFSLFFICIGILAELSIRIYHESQDKPPYFIKKTINKKN